jgi:DNA-directed RNA polymerase II subunit RPB1
MMATDSTILGIKFSIMSPLEIRKNSVAEIKTPNREAFVNNKPVIGGLYDPRLGVLDPGMVCPTDGLDNIECPGYFGHIELARPVFYIQYLDTVLSIIRCICIKCSKLLINKTKHKSLLNLTNERRWKQVYALCNKISCCGEFSETGCGCRQPSKYIHEGISTIIADWKTPPASLKIAPEMFIKIFSRISDEDITFMGFDPKFSRPEWMICQVLAVPPPAVRPSVKFDATQKSEDDITHILAQIIKANKILAEKLEKKDSLDASTIDNYHTLLQYWVATMVDNKIPHAEPAAQRTGRPFKSIKERLVGKTGRVRGNLMGKRVDFSSRSVIGPDPNLSIRELGVPLKIAQNITKPVMVNSKNIHYLSTLVKNGPVYPGAKLLEKVINGKSVHISLKYADRESITLNVGDIVHRHMMDGDVILFNRQPTLHRMSMMGHVARVLLTGNTFRMNVGCTKPYNADFDGDEMNLHMPQSLVAEIELKHLAAVPYQLISPASNQSIIGIFQDSLLSSYLITREKISFDPLTAMNIMVNLKRIDPAIFKQKSISSFDVLSQILPPMSSHQKNKMFGDSEDTKTSNNVIEIVNGQWIRGQIDKGVLSATSKGLIQRIYNDYGNFASADFIDNLQFIVNEYMTRCSFSVGISDLIIPHETKENIKSRISEKKLVVHDLIAQTYMGTFKNTTGKPNAEIFESEVNARLSEANSEASKIGKKQLSKNNRFDIMVRAGSKGSDINMSQMVLSCLGQQNVEGKRIPYGFDHRTLPHFSKFDDSPEARGFVESTFIDGLSPHELFFHAQGGRIGLIDTAVKTSTTGYIQRRIIKAMEDCKAEYDGTVRNNKNKIIQFFYGEDNIDPCKVESFHIPLCDMKIEQIYNHYFVPTELLVTSVKAKVNEQNTQYSAKSKNIIDFMLHARDLLIKNVFDFKNDYKVYVPVGIPYLMNHIYHQFKLSNQVIVDITPFEIFELLDVYYNKLESLGPYKPTMMFKIMYYYSLSPRELLIARHFTRDALVMLLDQIMIHYKRAIISPGESVGIIAAQSIGEPTTQMTLNTFHFAGVASKSNVTRGVPRIEEILSLTQTPKNPSVTMYLKPVDQINKEKALYYKNLIEYTKLSDISLKVDILFDPNGTEIIEDEKFIRDTADLHDLLKDCFLEKEVQRNPWVIRIELNKEELLERKISMDDINFAIKLSSFGNMNCIYSDYNAESLVLRIEIKDDEKSKNKSVFYDCDYIYKLKDVQNKLMNIVIRGVKNIKSVNLRTIKNNITWVNGNYEQEAIWVLDTVGTNLLSLLGLNYINPHKTISNDIKEVCNVLGIEAARTCIYNELTEVVEFDGAYINDHHKTLLCDRMTCTTPMTSIFRHGVNKDDIGPIAKASFEETPEMFLQAARHGEVDNMRGVSANIMCGQEGYYGTSSFNILLDLNEMSGRHVVKSEHHLVDQELLLNKCDSIQIHNNLGSIVNTGMGEDTEYIITI